MVASAVTLLAGAGFFILIAGWAAGERICIALLDRNSIYCGELSDFPVLKIVGLAILSSFFTALYPLIGKLISSIVLELYNLIVAPLDWSQYDMRSEVDFEIFLGSFWPIIAAIIPLQLIALVISRTYVELWRGRGRP